MAPVTGKALFSAIIINFNGGDDLPRCIDSLRAQEVPVEILVVDNGSTDESLDVVRLNYPDVRVAIPDANLGFAGGANFGSLHTQTEFLLFLNPDASLELGCLESFIETFRVRPRLGVCGPVLQTEAQNSREYGFTIDAVGNPFGLSHPQPPLYVSGCAMAVRREAFDELDGFDERYFMFLEDVDLCWRALLKGWDVQVDSQALVRHVGGTSAPGGYVIERKHQTSSFRLELRHRNTLATLLKCLPLRSLWWVLPMFVAHAMGLALVFALAGQLAAAWSIVRGVASNVRWRTSTPERRRLARCGARTSDRLIRTRMHRGIGTIRLLRHLSVPAVLPSPQVPRTSTYAPNLKRGRLAGTHATLVSLVPDGSTVLDIGCAEGYLGQELIGRGCVLHGIDINAEALVKARDVYEAAYPADLSKIEPLTLPDQFFDVILAADVLEHLPKPVDTLALLQRHLKPGGILIVSLPNIAHLSIRLQLMRGRFDYTSSGILDRTHLRFFTFKTARSFIEATGFRVEATLSGSDRFGRLLNGSPQFAHALRGLLAYNIILVATQAEHEG